MAPTGESSSPYLITHERGPMTRQVRNAVVAEGGEAAWQALLDRVSPACRARFSRPIGYFEWVEAPLARELHEARLQQVGAEFMAQRGEDAAREILSGVHAWLLRVATPGMIIQSTPRFLGFYYRGAEGSVLRLEAGEAEMEMRAAGHPDSWSDAGIQGFLRVALELAGAKAVETTYTRLGPDHHHYLVRWSR